MKGTALGAGYRDRKVGMGGATLHARTLGTSQSALSAMAAPPRRRIGLQVLLGILIFGVGGAATSDLATGDPGQNTLIEGLIAAILIFALIRVHQSRRQTYDDAAESYENTRVPLRLMRSLRKRKLFGMLLLAGFGAALVATLGLVAVHDEILKAPFERRD